MMNEPWTIWYDEWHELHHRDLFLTALEHAGVDNWEGYDEARALYEEWLCDEEEART